MLRIDKAIYLSLYFKKILSDRFSNGLWAADFYVFLELTNIVSTFYYNFVEFIVLLYTHLAISISWNKEYKVWEISFRKFSDVLPIFDYARTIGSHWDIC